MPARATGQRRQRRPPARAPPVGEEQRRPPPPPARGRRRTPRRGSRAGRPGRPRRASSAVRGPVSTSVRDDVRGVSPRPAATSADGPLEQRAAEPVERLAVRGRQLGPADPVDRVLVLVAPLELGLDARACRARRAGRSSRAATPSRFRSPLGCSQTSSKALARTYAGRSLAPCAEALRPGHGRLAARGEGRHPDAAAPARAPTGRAPPTLATRPTTRRSAPASCSARSSGPRWGRPRAASRASGSPGRRVGRDDGQVDLEQQRVGAGQTPSWACRRIHPSTVGRRAERGHAQGRAVARSGTMGPVTDWIVALMNALGSPGRGPARRAREHLPADPERADPAAGRLHRQPGDLNVVAAVAWTTLGSVVGAVVLYALGAKVGEERLRAVGPAHAARAGVGHRHAWTAGSPATAARPSSSAGWCPASAASSPSRPASPGMPVPRFVAAHRRRQPGLEHPADLARATCSARAGRSSRPGSDGSRRS